MNTCFIRRIAGSLVLAAGLLVTMRSAPAEEGFARAADFAPKVAQTGFHKQNPCTTPDCTSTTCHNGNSCLAGDGCPAGKCCDPSCAIGSNGCNDGRGCCCGRGHERCLLDPLGLFNNGKCACGRDDCRCRNGNHCRHCPHYSDDDGHCGICLPALPCLALPLPCLPGVPCLAGLGGSGPIAGCYGRVYAVDPYYHDFRDGAVYAAQGYNAPISVPLAPNVNHTMNYGWGIPSSRMTPVSRVVPSPYAVPPSYQVPQGYVPAEAQAMQPQ